MHGVVQGIGYRFAVARLAESLGVAGWVRNRTDGTVEIVVEGAPDRVESISSWCRRGPRGSRVEGVDVQEEEPEGFGDFRIR